MASETSRPRVRVPALSRRQVAVRQQSAYDGAAMTRRTRGWKRVGGDANTITAREAATLVHLARHLARNNADAVSGISVLVNNTIGTGITPHIAPHRSSGARLAKRRRDELEHRLRDHFDTLAIDADGLHTLYGLQRAAYRAMVQDGEVLIRRRRRRSADRLPLPFQIQLLEADYLDRHKTVATGGNRVIQGVEFDPLGRRVAYWLYPEHPSGVVWPTSIASRRIPASEIIHLYRVDRPGQVRGIPWLAPAVPAFFELHDYLDAQLVRQKIAALYGAFIYTPEDASVPGTETETDADGFAEEVETLEPGTQKTLPPGYDIKFGDPPPVDGLEVMTKVHQRRIARTLEITVEALTGDLSGVNFSSARMGWLEMHRAISSSQETLLKPRFCLPLEAWTREAIALSTSGAEDYRMLWAVPRREMIDPSREVKPLIDQVRAGFKSKQSVIRSFGEDPEEVRQEIADDHAADEAAGLSFDTDVASSQTPADPIEPSEEESPDE